MIKQLIIKNLFNQFNYNIEFNNSGINIITGPNGFGKSTILKIIEALIEKDTFDLSQFVFDEILVKSTDLSLTIQKKIRYWVSMVANYKFIPKEN